jgi:hypothetical protein
MPVQETLEWFSNPDNVNSDMMPPGLDTWDPVPYLSCAIPIFAGTLGANLVHEIGHRIAAWARWVAGSISMCGHQHVFEPCHLANGLLVPCRNVKLGPSFFIPNFQIGSFGAVTPIKSLLKNRSELWDVAAAGPLAGFTFSLALLLIGLDQSHPGALPQVGWDARMHVGCGAGLGRQGGGCLCGQWSS